MEKFSKQKQAEDRHLQNTPSFWMSASQLHLILPECFALRVENDDEESYSKDMCYFCHGVVWWYIESSEYGQSFAFGGGGWGVVAPFLKEHRTDGVCDLCASGSASVRGWPPKKKWKLPALTSYESSNIAGCSEIGRHSTAEALVCFEGRDMS